MEKEHRTYAPIQRLLSALLAFVMVLGYVPNLTLTAKADQTAPITTVNDPYVEVNSLDTLIYGSNTKNAGKVTVDKNVVDDTGSITLPNVGTLKASTDNFLVQVSQSAQTMALSSEIPVPIDAVFVLDTSGSMNEGENKPDRASSLRTATNDAIATLMAANPDNRVGVVAFSSEGYGDGSSLDAAANVLSDLDHYTDNGTSKAATEHLFWANRDGKARDQGEYLAGRNQVTLTNRWGETTFDGYACRNAHDGGTNIQAGIALGAKMLTSVPQEETKVTYTTGSTSRTVTRMPVLIIVSDGCPTFSPSDTTWYDPTQDGEVGPGNAPYEGEAFLTALTAAYYKGLISEHYYGADASEEQHCSVYTVGVDITTNNGYMNADEEAQAEFALDPASNAVSGNNYYSYGNSWNENNRLTTYAPATYWNRYNAATAANFDVRTDYYRQEGPGGGSYVTENYTVTAASINATRNYVNGYSAANNLQMYAGGIGYNDEYFSASNSDLNDQFAKMIMKIQLKAMSSVTKISEYGADFSGYVTFIDTIGEFMEVKDMKGIYAGGNFYEGATAAYYMANGDNATFNSKLQEVLQTRLDLINSTVTASSLISAARASANQAYHKSATDYDNSIVWWGNAYSDGGDLENKVQCLGFADDDSIEYIKTATGVPEGADVVVRSYFFTADGTNNEYLYFIVRVMRSLSAPYQQTVTVSAPASLLSVDKVLVNEKLTTNGTEYTVKLEDAPVARVIYEVGLRSDINANNVASVVASEMDGYAAEVDAGGLSENYTQSTDTYHFFTNDWDRTKDGSEHHRAVSQAIFEAAEDNDFYIYQEDTYLVDANGNKLTSAVNGTTAYIERVVYTWNPTTQPNSDSTYNATRSVEKIPVTVRDASILGTDNEGNLYIKKGTHAESTLAAASIEDTPKSNNATGTALVVRHPHYSGTKTSHYTVLLGNNGKLSLKYEAPKTVWLPNENNVLVESNGKPVMVGETLEYRIQAINSESQSATIVITDTIPAGTEYVSSSPEATRDGDKLTWTLTDVPAGQSVTVSFKVLVTEAAVNVNNQIGDIENTATIKIGNNPAYTTNTTTNPPEGKTVTDGNGADLTGNVKVGDELTYYIQWANDAVDESGNPAAAKITITDVIPTGTTFLSFTGSHADKATNSNGTLKWEFDAAAGATGYVSFKVVVNASAKIENNNVNLDVTNFAEIQIGENGPTQETNRVTVGRDTGKMSVKKLVNRGSGIPDSVTLPDAAFTFRFTESTGTLNGSFIYTQTSKESNQTVTFANGTATISNVKANDVIVIDGLPLGAKIAVGEAEQDSWIMNCTCRNEGISPAGDETFIDAPTLVEITANSGATSTVDLTITNCYHPTPAHFQLKGTKYYKGEITDKTNFTFTATQVQSDQNGSLLVDANGEVALMENGGSATAMVTFNTGDTSDTFTMTGREFYVPTVNYYLIKEAAIAGTSMVMAENQYMLKLVVSENAAGQLEANAWIATKDENGWTDVTWTDTNKFSWATDTATISFTNTAPTPSDAVVISGTKNLTGRNIKNNEFGFALYEVTATAGEDGASTDTETLVQTVNLGADGNSNSGTFAFNLTYDVHDMIEDGVTQTSREFKYRVKEIKGTDKDITYATNSYDVTVTVTLDKNTGKLNGEVSMPEGGIIFNNKYNGETSLQLTGTKTFYNYAKDGSNHQFSFTVKDEAGKEVSGASVTIEGTEGTETYTSAITFAPIYFTSDDMWNEEQNKYDAEKVFKYTVSEIVPVEGDLNYDPNIMYSPVTYNVEIKVTYDSNTGEMSALVISREEPQAVMANNETNLSAGYDFNNIKNPASIQTVVGATKNISGMHVPEGLRFSFDLVGVTISENGDITRGNVQATGTSEATTGGEGTIATPSTPASTALDEPTDTTEESKPADTTEESKPADTTEESKPADTTEESKPVATSTESDLIRSSASGVPGEPIVVSETQNIPYTENQAVTFTPLTFYEEGTYWYIMEESNTSAQNGVGYDKTKYLVEVAVGYDTNGKFTVMNTLYYPLLADREGTNKSHFDTNHTEPVFNNTYNADVALNLTATKVLTGRDLNENEFDFVLERLNSNGTGVGSINGTHGSASAGNPATITFASLNYSSDAVARMATKHTDGSYYIHYMMREIKPSSAYLPGITYDVSQYLVTIKVTVPEEAGGKMTAVLHKVTPIQSTDVITNVMSSAESGESIGTNSIGAVKEGSTATFTNSYSVTTGTSVTLEVTKTLTGRDINAGEFSFILERQDKDAEENVWKQVGTTTNNKVEANSGKVTFTRNFTAATLDSLSSSFVAIKDEEGNETGKSEYTTLYKITEVTPSAPGVTTDPDNTPIYAKVVIVHDESNASYSIKNGYPQYFTSDNCAESNKVTDPKFVNKYTPTSVPYYPNVTKNLIGRNEKNIGANEFSFDIYTATAIGTQGENSVEVAGGSTAAGTTTANVSFSVLTFNASDMVGATESTTEDEKTIKTKDFYYVIKEAQGTDATITYSTEEIYLKVTVTDDGNGALTAAGTYYKFNAENSQWVTTDTPTFTNHYGPGEVDVELKLQKKVVMKDAAGDVIKGKDYSIQESEFDVTAVSTTVPGVTIPGTTAAGKGTAVINLGTRTFTHAMMENATWNDSTKRYEKTFTYTVTEDEPANKGAFTYDGETITISVTIYDDGYGNMTASEPTYSKSNGSGEAITGADTFVNTYTYKASTPLKLYAKKELHNKALTAEEFKFTLSGNGISQQKMNNADGLVTFDDLSFNAPGEYTYTIEEVNESKPNYTYDGTKYSVVVKVESDVAGNLIASPVYYSSYDAQTKNGTVVAAPVVFTNSYTPSPIEENLTEKIGASKTIRDAEGNNVVLPLDGFEFQVTDSSGQPVIGADGTGADGTTPIPITGKSDAKGKITFSPAFKFTASGEYHYYITETTEKTGYTKDPATWSVYVQVTYDRAAGALKLGNVVTEKVVTIAQDLEDGEPEVQANEKPVFVNIYNPAPTSVTITADKKLVNQNTSMKRELRGGEFKFYLMDGNTIVAEAHNAANGSIAFTVNYSAKDMSGVNKDGYKEFRYTIVEDTSERLGYIDYAANVADVVVRLETVTQNEDARLAASVASGNGQTFTNTYRAADVTAQITATKSLAGLKLDKAEKFKFRLIEGLLQKDAEGKVTVVNAAGEPIDLSAAQAVQTTTNDANGQIVFNMNYSLKDLNGAAAKDYHYVLYEAAAGTEGMTYDTTLHPVTVTVTDDQKGNLSAVVTYGEDGKGTAPIIYNTYKGKAQFVTLEAVKALSAPNSQTMTLASKALDGKFSFQLLTKDADGNETILETVTNQAKLDDKGNVVDYSAVKFSSLEFKDAGTYTYYIREVKGGMAGMTYDTAERKVIVTVTQDVNDGQYDVSVTYHDAEGKALAGVPTITNTYKMEAVRISLEAAKKLNGRDLRNGEFSFEVHDSNGTRVAKATNAADGKIVFTDIKLPVAGSYKLTISEVRGTKLFVTYDKHKYTVTVEVSETDGVLKVDKITYPVDEIVFKNTYNPSGSAATGDQMPLLLMGTAMVLSAAAIVILLIWWKKRKNR